ncbi:MAG: anthranilate synthase component I, partial [Alphaproteobacteria bacterium]|nr:anthranilate synthase component I [Alphaproteobacteria bacterium]
GAVRGRYSILGFHPDLIWQCEGKKSEILRLKNGIVASREACPGKSLDALRKLVNDSRMDTPPELPPMAAGVTGFMAYDMIRQVENIPDKNPDLLGVPDAVFIRPTVTAIFDNVADAIFVITPVWPEKDISAAQAYVAAQERLTGIVGGLEKRSAFNSNLYPLAAQEVTFTPNMTREDYHRMVLKAKEYIAAGDIFQVVPSQRFTADFPFPPFALYRALRHLNPSPFLVYLQLPEFSLVCSSPEILVRLRDGKVTIRPIAGTRKRGKDDAEDKALAADLLADPKEIAEHLMLLDLGRNDVGRVAKIGSVKVTERMVIEYYSHVMHIVSNVEGDIATDKDAIDALMAGFPAGTVSGAPKIRAMEIIDELEGMKRKFYAGCVGYFSGSGAMDTCITLRTGLIKNGKLHIQAGGGVVADSDPEAEYQESCNKAKALMKAAEEAIKFG